MLRPFQKDNLITGSFVACVLLLSSLLQGCNMGTIVGLGYLIGGPPSVEPNFDEMTGLSMTAKDVTVAVVCYAPNDLKWDFSEVDYEVMKFVSNRLFTHHIKVMDSAVVHAWLDEHPNWDKPEEIGAAFDATYVVYIDLNKFSLYEKGSQNLYRGRAEAMVSVFEMDDDGTGEKIYSKDITSAFPTAIPRSTQDITYSRFKREYLEVLSEEIGRLFYEYYNGDDMNNST